MAFYIFKPVNISEINHVFKRTCKKDNNISHLKKYLVLYVFNVLS